MNARTENKKLGDITIGEFKELILELVPMLNSQNNSQQKQYVYGLQELADVLKCSRSKASQIKSSGIIDEAIIQHEKFIMVDVNKALKLMHETTVLPKNNKRKK